MCKFLCWALITFPYSFLWVFVCVPVFVCFWCFCLKLVSSVLAKAAFHIHKNCGFPFPAHIRKHNRLTLGFNCVLDSTWTRFSFRFTSTFSLPLSPCLLFFLFFLLFVVRELFWKLKYVCTFRPKAAAEIVSKGLGKLGMAIRVGVIPMRAVCNLHGSAAAAVAEVGESHASSQWALNKNILSKHKGGCHCTQSGSVDLAEPKKTVNSSPCAGTTIGCWRQSGKGSGNGCTICIGLPKKD